MWRFSWPYSLAAGASFLSPDARKKIFGYDSLAELRLLVDLADLIALAHASPESREGRRARAALTNKPFNQFTTIGILAAIAIPNFIEYREKADNGAAETPPAE